MWDSLRKLCTYLRGTTVTDEARLKWDKTITNFMKRYIACWDESKVTRYMHLLYSQGAFFLNEYGAFGIWSAQAIEKSHWREKNNYIAKTSKGGGTLHICPLLQLTTLSFRNIMHPANAANLRKKVANAQHTGCTESVLALQQELALEEEQAMEAEQLLGATEEVVQGVEDRVLEDREYDSDTDSTC
jgi:hypothetical protein